MTITTLLEDVVRGPQELPLVGKCLTIEPVRETTRANRYPSQAVVVTAAARRIIELSKAGDRLESIVVLGDLDPTMHPEFREISENLRELCNKWYPKAKLTLISDNPELGDLEICHALLAYDRPIVRLEAGTQKTHTALSGRPGKTLKEAVEGLHRIEHRNLVVRTQLVRGKIDNSTDSEIKAWIRFLGQVKPSLVRLSTPAKAQGDCKPITKTRMNQVVNEVSEKVGVQVEVD